jgi:hypothetical protein
VLKIKQTEKMSKKIILKLTVSQMSAMINMADSISAMIGNGTEQDYEWSKNIKLFDKMLNTNGYSRGHK